MADPGLSSFHGLLQHSFALRMPPDIKARYTDAAGRDPYSLLVALFQDGAESRGFSLRSVGELTTSDPDPDPGGYSLLVKRRQVPFEARPLAFIDHKPSRAQQGFTYPLPEPFAWAGLGGAPNLLDPNSAWDGFITEHEPEPADPQCANDYLLTKGEFDPAETTNPCAISWLLAQLLAHRRSRLFGPSLAKRIFNVLLPYTVLCSTRQDARDWVMQPAFSLFSMPERSEFRPLFSFTLFMVPVRAGEAPDGTRTVTGRGVERSELAATASGWALAVATPFEAQPTFTAVGPLPAYLEANSPQGLGELGLSASEQTQQLMRIGHDGSQAPASLTIRQITEAIAFTYALRLVAGPGGEVTQPNRRKIGERVLTSMSASRVSAVVLLDSNPTNTMGDQLDALKAAMKSTAGPVQVELDKEHRIDRAYYDSGRYAIGVLPGQRCIVVTTLERDQQSYQESGLLQAGWIAYIAIGAATATGMIRALYRDIERADSPRKIADVEHEIVVDLHEIYDLDITGEMYKHRYKLVRGLLGVEEDYAALMNKLQALHQRATTTFEQRAQRRLEWLTVAIVLLSALILAFTIVVAAK